MIININNYLNDGQVVELNCSIISQKVSASILPDKTKVCLKALNNCKNKTKGCQAKLA